MQTTKINGREYTITERIEVAADLIAMRADLAARGYEPATYVLKGKRGAQIIALKSTKTGEFSKLY